MFGKRFHPLRQENGIEGGTQYFSVGRMGYQPLFSLNTKSLIPTLAAIAMNTSIRGKLFLMMVLEFFIWGAWLPLIFTYLPSLGFSSSVPPKVLQGIVPHGLWFVFSQQSLILNAFPFAAIVGMFFSNQYADRHFSAEKFLAFSQLISGLALLGLATIKAPAAVPGLAAGEPNPNAPFALFFGLMLIHCLLYVPTISITNSI